MPISVLRNPHRRVGLPAAADLATGRVFADPSPALELLRRCPKAAATPLRDMPGLAAALNVGAALLKDESRRMGLGSFKALGAAYVIARMAAARAGAEGDMSAALRGTTIVCASAGNHGLSVAAGARLFGARAEVYLPATAPAAFAERLRRLGARATRVGADYEASMAAAAKDASANGWFLLSDSSWHGYTETPARVMEGYLVVGAEAADEMSAPPDHIFLQAGVGGMAAALAAFFRARWGDAPTIAVVEPAAAAGLMESVRAGRLSRASGPPSVMGRLDCKEPSHLALAELSRSADFFVAVEDSQSADAAALLAAHGVATTPSGAAGVAALRHVGEFRARLGLTAASRVLAIVSEGAEDAEDAESAAA